MTLRARERREAADRHTDRAQGRADDRGLRRPAARGCSPSFVAPYDAHVVERLNGAGSVLVGKTNMDEFAMGSSNENSASARCAIPGTDVPGGSSGGSAAAVAAGLVPGATGTDTGGSIRQPAALTGISGLKPTYGVVSRYGLIAFASSLDTAGPFARTAHDCALLLNAMAGTTRATRRRSSGREDYARDFARLPAQPSPDLRIGCRRVFRRRRRRRTSRRRSDAALAQLRSSARRRSTSSSPYAHSVPVYYVIAPAEASSNLSRFDGVRYGHRAKARYRDLDDMYKKTRAEGFGAEVKRRILVGTYVLSHGYYDAYYLRSAARCGG